jgi:hypothetical protein
MGLEQSINACYLTGGDPLVGISWMIDYSHSKATNLACIMPENNHLNRDKM